MFRESVHLLIFLSVLINTSVSLHMIRDAYNRPLTELHTIQRDIVASIDSTQNVPAKRIFSADHYRMRATRNPPSNIFTYNEFYPSDVLSSATNGSPGSSSRSSSSSSSLSSSLPLSILRSATKNTGDRYRWQKKTMPLSWQNVPVPIAQPLRAINNTTEQRLEPKEKKQKPEQRQSQSIQSHKSKRTSNGAQMGDNEDLDVESFVDRNFNDYNDARANDHMDDDISQSPIAKGLPTKFMFRGMRGQRQYDVPQIECPPAMDGMERFACPTPDRQGRYRCIDDHVLCDGFIDCPDGDDEERQACMFYKTTKAHLDVLADALLRWARGR